MGPLASFQQVLERFTWSFREGLWWDLAQRVLGAEIHPSYRRGEGQGAEEMDGPEKDPGIILIPAGEVPTGLSALVVQRTEEVLGHAAASPGSRCQDLPFQSQGMAEKSLPG